MGLLETEIYELRNLRKAYRDKKIDEKQVNTEIAIYSQVEKRAKLLLQAYSVSAKIKSGLLKEIFKTNLIGEGTAIDVEDTDPEDWKVKCPEKGEVITRSDCLEYSGSNFDRCKNCEIGALTKKILLPVPKHFPQG